MGVENDAYRYAVKNAFLHDGKADLKAVIGKIKALHSDADLGEIMPMLQETLKKVNAMGFARIEEEYRKFEASYELKPKLKKPGLQELDWAGEEKVVTRFAPNPNGPFHLGNARAAILSYEYAREYNGKFLLRFDDTDPKVKKPIENAEQIFREDLGWLGIEVKEVYFASDRLELYYRYARKLIKIGKAYVCTCETDDWRRKITNGKACGCREKNVAHHTGLFEQMLKNELKEGTGVLRIKTDLGHKDPSIRDWWLMKVVDKPQHPRVKGFHAWPSYNFASAIDDHELGVTLVIRGQEHEQNKTKQEFLYNYFGWKYPHCFHTGRISLEGMVLSTSKISGGIGKGEYTGWDDPRLGTIRALRRRGFAADTLRNAILDIGVKSTDSTIEMNRLVAINKDVLGDVQRITFIDDPVKLNVDYAPAMEVELDGNRISMNEGLQELIISKKELKTLEVGKGFRLRNAYNVMLKGKSGFDAHAEYTGSAKGASLPIIGWLEMGADVCVTMPDNSTIMGVGNEILVNMDAGKHVYLEKFGYARVDGVDGGRVLLRYSHK